jgi:hypothetical protein
VTVSASGGKETLFASGPDGTAAAPWIAPGFVYVFRLYSLMPGHRLLARLQIGRATQLQVLAPPEPPKLTSPLVNRLLQILSFASVALLAILAAMHIKEALCD